MKYMHPDGELTPAGLLLASQYADAWRSNRRLIGLEAQHPELEELFYDIRVDAELAERHSTLDDVAKSLIQLEKDMADAYPYTRFHITVDAHTGELMKGFGGGHKYIRRFRGSDGKWNYVYADDGKGGRSKRQAESEARRTRGANEKPVKDLGVTRTERQSHHPEDVILKRQWVDRIPGEPMGIANPKGDDGGTFRKYGGNMATGRVTDPKRAALHDKIVNEAVNKVQAPPPGVQKYAVVMMGGPASGKSSATKNMDLDDFVHVDPDAVKDDLPEMKKGLNLGKTEDGTVITARSSAACVHEESSQIAKRIRNQAISEGKNVLVDGTGKNGAKHAKLIKSLQEKGYKVTLVMAHQELETANQLNKGRATTSGRYVPDEVVAGAYGKIPFNFEELSGVADTAIMFDASRGHPPKHVWSVDKGPPRKDTAHDEKFVEGFKRKHYKKK